MFEISCKYYAKNEDGEYDKTEIKTETKKIGKNFEDVSLDKLASYVISQLARRDILVVDFNVFEFVKKPVSFKQTNEGVLLKNKKFLLNGTIETVEEDIPPPAYLQPIQSQAPQQPMEKQSNQAIRWEVFDPDPMTIPMLARKFKLTPKRKYPIIQEKTITQKVNLPTGMTEIPGYEYIVIDDLGKNIKIPSMHFMPEQKGLIGMENRQMTEQDYNNAPKLMHMGGYGSDMPILRG